jgi:hypothetical protein
VEFPQLRFARQASAKQRPRFVAEVATARGTAYDWPRVRALPEQLLDQAH